MSARTSLNAPEDWREWKRIARRVRHHGTVEDPEVAAAAQEAAKITIDCWPESGRPIAMFRAAEDQATQAIAATRRRLAGVHVAAIAW